MHSTPVACHSYVYGSVKGWGERVEGGGGVTWKGKVERMNGMGGGGGRGGGMVLEIHKNSSISRTLRAEELCESRGGRPGLQSSGAV